MNLFAKFSQNVSSQSFAIAHILNVSAIFNDGVQQFWSHCHFSFEEPKERIVH